MTGFRFVPESWKPSADTLSWCREKGLTDSQIREQVEAIKDHQYKRNMHRPDACFRNWIRNAIKWGEITPCRQTTYRSPEPLSDEQRKKDIQAFENDMRRFHVVK